MKPFTQSQIDILEENGFTKLGNTQYIVESGNNILVINSPNDKDMSYYALYSTRGVITDYIMVDNDLVFKNTIICFIRSFD